MNDLSPDPQGLPFAEIQFCFHRLDLQATERFSGPQLSQCLVRGLAPPVSINSWTFICFAGFFLCSCLHIVSGSCPLTALFCIEIKRKRCARPARTIEEAYLVASVEFCLSCSSRASMIHAKTCVCMEPVEAAQHSSVQFGLFRVPYQMGALSRTPLCPT